MLHRHRTAHSGEGKEVPKRAGDGKKLEGELGRALHHLGAWDYNSNDPTPACDRIVHWEGHGILAECKECRSHKLEWSRFTDNEVKHLCWHAGLPRPGDPRDEYKEPRPPHGLTIVFVQLVGVATWVAHWRDVVAMYEAAPFKYLALPFTDPRWREVPTVEGRTRQVLGVEGVLRGMISEVCFV